MGHDAVMQALMVRQPRTRGDYSRASPSSDYSLHCVLLSMYQGVWVDGFVFYACSCLCIHKYFVCSVGLALLGILVGIND